MAPVYYQIKSVYPLQIQNDQVVNVTFQTNNASSSDWIAAYSPPISMYVYVCVYILYICLIKVPQIDSIYI